MKRSTEFKGGTLCRPARSARGAAPERAQELLMSGCVASIRRHEFVPSTSEGTVETTTGTGRSCIR